MSEFFDYAAKIARDQIFIFDLERVAQKCANGECICNENERSQFTCPIHKVRFPKL